MKSSLIDTGFLGLRDCKSGYVFLKCFNFCKRQQAKKNTEGINNKYT